VDDETFEQLVDSHYASLYRFALSLTRREADAWDLTQETFKQLAARGHQMKDRSKAKAWLFTTLHRRFLTRWRRESRFPHVELSVVTKELPATASSAERAVDGGVVLEALGQLRERYRAPLTLFYLEEHSYIEIAEILRIPIGTVMSRISRGREILRAILVDQPEPRVRSAGPPAPFNAQLMMA